MWMMSSEHLNGATHSSEQTEEGVTVPLPLLKRLNIYVPAAGAHFASGGPVQPIGWQGLWPSMAPLDSVPRMSSERLILETDDRGTNVSHQELWPDSLLNWLRIIDIEGYKLLQAVDQNGYYFAVKQDADGDVVFCQYRHTSEVVASTDSVVLRVSTLKGEDLFDWGSKKMLALSSAKIEYSTQVQVGPVSGCSSVTVAYLRGICYPLIEHRVAEVRVSYTRGGEESEILFDQVVELVTK